MYLDKVDEMILNGEYGEAKRIALKIIIGIGEVLGAEKLIPVSHAHISGISYFNIGDAGLSFLEEMLLKGAKANIFTTANPFSIAIHEDFIKYYKSDVVEKQRKIIEILTKIGVAPNSFTCIPYKVRKPAYGEHVAWAESSAVIYANSILGIYTNRESGISSLMASIIGKTYYAGMHIDENREPVMHIIVKEDLKTISLASILGLYIGQISKGVPLIDIKIAVENSIYRDLILRSLLSSIATTSDLPLAIIKNVTPIARYKDVDSLDRIEIELKDIKIFTEESCSNMLFLGCPHMTLEEAEFILNTMNLENIEKLGIEKIFIAIPFQDNNKFSIKKRKNIEIQYLPGVCPVVSDLIKANIHSLATVHGKALYYIPKLARVKSCMMNIV